MNLIEMLRKYDAFIFDFDGVIVDSLGVKSEAFGQLFVDLGPEVMEKVKLYHLRNGGVSRYEKFKYYFRTFRGKEITAQESAMLDKQYSDLVVRKVVEADYIPGVVDVLKVIKTNNKFCCVISATPQDEIRHIVRERDLGNFFQVIVGSPRSKKENVGLVLAKHKLVSQKTLYFGDARSDYEAALAYGVDFIAVMGGGGKELLSQSEIIKIQDFLVY